MHCFVPENGKTRGSLEPRSRMVGCKRLVDYIETNERNFLRLTFLFSFLLLRPVLIGTSDIFID